MSFFVAIHQEAWPDRLDTLLGTIRQNLAAAATLHPGRRAARLFQRFGQPTHLLGLSEWVDEQSFEQLRQSPEFHQLNDTCGMPPRIETLEPLRRFERMEQRVAIASCVRIVAPPVYDRDVQEFLLSHAHHGVKSMSGLVSREVYRVRHRPGEFLALRSWTSLADLERFRAGEGTGFDATLIQLGATVERFTGALAAELSLLHR